MRWRQEAGWLRRAQEAREQKRVAESLRKTRWACHSCDTSGVVTHPTAASAHAVNNLIRGAHKALSPRCGFDNVDLQPAGAA